MKSRTDNRGYIDGPEMERYLGIGHTKRHEMMKQGELPKPYKFGPRTYRWKVSELEDWAAKKREGEA